MALCILQNYFDQSALKEDDQQEENCVQFEN